MIRSLAILAIATLIFYAAAAQQTNDQIHLRATVQDVITLSSFSGTVTPVDIDPRFALIVCIASVTPGVTNFAAGSLVTFAIHSPARLFAGGDAKGKAYDFSLRRKTENGKTVFSELELRTKQAAL